MTFLMKMTRMSEGLKNKFKKSIMSTLFKVSKAASACLTAGSALAKSSSHLFCLSDTRSLISATLASSSETYKDNSIKQSVHCTAPYSRIVSMTS